MKGGSAVLMRKMLKFGWLQAAILVVAVGWLDAGASAQEKGMPAKAGKIVQQKIPAKSSEMTSSTRPIAREVQDKAVSSRSEGVRRELSKISKPSGKGNTGVATLDEKAFQARLDEASSGMADAAQRRLGDLHMEIETRFLDLDTSLTDQRALRKETEEKAKSIVVKVDASTLPPEERLRRQQSQMEKSAAEAKVQSLQKEIGSLEAQCKEAQEQLRQVETKLAELGTMKAVPSVAAPPEAVAPVVAKPIGPIGPIRPIRPIQALEKPVVVRPVRPLELQRPALVEPPKRVVQRPTRAGERVLPAVAAEPSSETKTAEAVAESSEPIAIPRMGVLSFLRDRALDLCDLFRFRLHAPKGFRGVGVKARGTCLAQVGFIYSDGRSVGNDRRAVGVWRERRLEGGVGPVYFSRLFAERIAGNRYMDIRRPWSRMFRRGIVRNGIFWDDGRLHPLSAGAEIHLPVFGVEFEVYPLEALDAALGWVGLDPFNDDEGRLVRQWQLWQTIRELKVHDEWEESYDRVKKETLPTEKSARAGIKVEMPAEKRPPSGELPLGESEK